MTTKRSCLVVYFNYQPVHLDMLQDKENGMTQKELSKKYRYGLDNIKRIRKELIKIFGIKHGGWPELCKEAVLLDLVTEKQKPKYFFADKPSQYLLDKLEELELREEEKKLKQRERNWKKRKKELKW